MWCTTCLPSCPKNLEWRITPFHPTRGFKSFEHHKLAPSAVLGWIWIWMSSSWGVEAVFCPGYLMQKLASPNPWLAQGVELLKTIYTKVFYFIFELKLCWLLKTFKYFYIHPYLGCMLIFHLILIYFSSSFCFFIKKL